MSQKKLLAVNLNEFNLKFLRYGAKKYNCQNIKKLLKLKKISTFSIDKTQDKDLDPWVQSISINSGKRSKEHGIFNLGEKITKNIFQIWDYLSHKRKYSAIWGPMNTKFKNNKYVKIFVPDPWNYQTDLKPKELKAIYNLARSYAQNYSDLSLIKNVPNFINFFLFTIKRKIIFKLLYSVPSYLKIIFKNGISNYFLFFLFDIISLHTFEKISKNHNIDFSLIFLNSLAHFQHNNWDNKKYEKDYFYFLDQILKIIFQISRAYDSLIIYNGFSQKKINAEYMIRPRNPEKFFKIYGIKFKKFHSNMTNGALITFRNKFSLKNQLKKIENMNVLGFKLLETKVINSNQIFCRFQIRSKINFSAEIINKQKIKKSFFYEDKQKNIIKNIDNNIFKFLKNIYFIKTTSKHISKGSLFYQNLKINENTIENIKINKIIKDYF